MKISIAMCTYNGARYLQQQLDSLLAQTRRPDQIVICDDVSSDATPEILQRFVGQADAAGVEVLLQANVINLGYVRNFETCLQLCDGDLIFLCDQDDVWMSDKLERFAARFAADPALLLLHADARLVDGDGQDMQCGLFQSLEVTAAELSAVHADQALAVLLRRNLVTGATAALRRELVGLALPVESGWIHDEWLAMAAAASGGRVDCLEWHAIDYRQHGANQIGARKRSLAQKLMRKRGVWRVHLANYYRRLDALLLRCNVAGWMADGTGDLRLRVMHFHARANMPNKFLSRMRIIWRLYLGGGYSRFDSGWRALVVDVLGLR